MRHCHAKPSDGLFLYKHLWTGGHRSTRCRQHITIIICIRVTNFQCGVRYPLAFTARGHIHGAAAIH